MREASDSSTVHVARNVPNRLAHAVAGGLLATSIFYAAAATTFLPPKLPASEIVEMLVAGTLPTLLVTLVLWVACPWCFDRRLRRQLIGVSLSGAAVVAIVLLMIAGD